MDTLTKSCSPTIVITANGEVQTHEEATVSRERIGCVLDYESPRGTRQQSYRSESFAMKTDILVSGSTVENPHLIQNMGFGYSATRRPSFRSWFQA